MDEIKGWPWNPTGTMSYKQRGEEEIPNLPDIRPAPGESNYTPRGLRITAKHLYRAGHTAGCPKCREIMRGVKTSLGHSAACRIRVQEAMMADRELKKEVEAAEERVNKHIARQLEELEENDYSIIIIMQLCQK